MNIKLKPYRMSENEYFKLLLKIKFGRTGWIYLLFFILASIALFYSTMLDLSNSFILFYFILTIILPIYYILYYWRFTKNKMNKILYETKEIKIDGNYLYGNLQDGSEDKINMNNIVKYASSNTYIILYINKSSFIYLPKRAFDNEEEFKKFLEYIIDLFRQKSKNLDKN